MLRKSYYLILGVSRNETSHGIREAFLNLAKRYHPDRLAPERLHFFQRILEAYQVLSDPARRSQYDRGLEHAGAGAEMSRATISLGVEADGSLPQARTILRAVALKDAVFEAALARVSGSLTAAQLPAKESPEPLTARVILSSDEAAHGGIIFLSLPTCFPCERCGGSGQAGMFSCSGCDGEGLIEEQETVRVHVPPMVGDGTLLEVPLRGLGVHDFYLRVQIRVAYEASYGQDFR
jgi:molecular chaperone DnaJ